MAPKSASQQRTISSFFTPKSTSSSSTSKPTPSRATPSKTPQTNGSHKNLVARFALPPPSQEHNKSKRKSESGEDDGSDVENQEPQSKKRRVVSDDDEFTPEDTGAIDKEPNITTVPIERDLSIEREISPPRQAQQDNNASGNGVTSDRTARFIFSSSPMVNHDNDEDDTEVRRNERQRLHEKFVKKLGRPDSLADIRRRNNIINEADAAEGAVDGDEEEEDDDDEPASKRGKGAATKKGGSKLTPMLRQYLELKRDNLDKVIIYQVGYKYKFLGEDARTAAKVLSIVCIPGKYRYDEHPDEAHLDRFASASIPIGRLHVHVKRLVAAGHKVGVVDQVETAALKKVGNNRNTPFIRKLTHVYTQGTYVDDLEGLEGGQGGPSATGTGYLLCLTEKNSGGVASDEKVHVGIVAVQPTTGTIIYDDFEDGFMRGEIETRLLHIAPCEYLIIGDLSTATRKLIKHLSGSKSNIFGVKARVEHKEKTKTTGAESFSHVTSFYANKVQSTGTATADEAQVHTLDKVTQLPESVTVCLSAMIKHLSEYGLEHVFDLTSNFQSFSMRTHMTLNSNTLNSLEIYANQTDQQEKGSLFWRLDRTKTRFGRRMLRNWVGRPLLDKTRLQKRIDAVEEIKNSDGTRESDRLKRVLNKIKSDLEKIVLRIYYKRASRPEVLGFLQSMQRISDEFAHVTDPSLSGWKSEELQRAVTPIPQIGEHVVSFLNRLRLQAAKDDDKYNFFREEYESEDILDHKVGIAGVEYDLDNHRADAAAKLGRKMVQYTTVAGIEFLIEVENTKTALSKVPASWAKISNTKKCSRFHTPEVVKLIRQRDQHKESLAAACDEAFERFMEEIGDHYQMLRDCIRAVATLDCLASLADVASQPGYCKPEFVDDACIEVVQGRHPMVEQLLLDSYVPNDISLSAQSAVSSISESQQTGNPNAILITGPNMGGKSSYVRSVALVSIMGQIGSYVPAASARLGMLDAVFTRMGAFDNMMRGESTFMVELGETSDILKQATRRSLVILDELGRGTSTHDGVAIAEAVLRELVQRGVMTMFITHYQDLARVEKGLGGRLRNVHVKFEESGEKGNEDVTFLYEVCEGVAHRSYG
jgi:DNA mismatch repair protein MSH3